MIQRALAIVPDPDLRRVYPDAPWLPHFPPEQARSAWSWTAPAAALVPLLVLFWLANTMAFKKAYLRRRPPNLPPLHQDLVTEAKMQIARGGNIYRKIAQSLQTRTGKLTAILDMPRTIAATITGGGEMIVPVMRQDHHMPEYLVLIEQRSAFDQDTERLLTMVARLSDLLPLRIFTFQSEPSLLHPIKAGLDGDQYALSIEYLQSAYPQYRLLVLGSGAEFLDPVNLKPRPSATALMHWDKRALLTPLPLAEWGHEEFALAHALQMPLGRATAQGFLKLAEMLGLEGAESTDLIDTGGDDLAQQLPETLRLRPQKFLYDNPPDDMSVADCPVSSDQLSLLHFFALNRTKTAQLAL